MKPMHQTHEGTFAALHAVHKELLFVVRHLRSDPDFKDCVLDVLEDLRMQIGKSIEHICDLEPVMPISLYKKRLKKHFKGFRRLKEESYDTSYMHAFIKDYIAEYDAFVAQQRKLGMP